MSDAPDTILEQVAEVIVDHLDAGGLDAGALAADLREQGLLAPVPPPALRTISPRDFRDGGYLQEVNRLLLHRLGLALSVDAEANTFGPIWDYRKDEEGILFCQLDDAALGQAMDHAEKVQQEVQAHASFRALLFHGTAEGTEEGRDRLARLGQLSAGLANALDVQPLSQLGEPCPELD